jgi:CheY-like chemotaxis protein
MRAAPYSTVFRPFFGQEAANDLENIGSVCYNHFWAWNMIDRTEFNRLVRDGLSNLCDYAALETHALASVFPIPPGQRRSRAEHLRHLLLHAIEKLQPPDRECSVGSVEWRPYLILHGRYVEGLSLQELQTRLSLSDRQLRREHSRALRAVAAWLWDQAFPGRRASEDQGTQPERWSNSFRAFEIAREPLDLAEVVRGVAGTLHRRVQGEGVELHLVLPEELPPALADRVILRQILLTLLSYALDVRRDGDIAIGTDVRAGQVALWIQFQVDDPSSLATEEEETSLEAARYWAQRLNVTLEAIQPPGAQAGSVRLALSLPRAGQLVVMVVDDQVPAIRMFQRYLSRSNIRVVGVQEPDQVLPSARQLQPQAVTLDVMMPTMDGWEILQALQADPETRHIPVIVCSVWDEPELAFSLGAADFLKKPITQRDLLGALARLRLLDMPPGSSPGNTSGQT